MDWTGDGSAQLRDQIGNAYGEAMPGLLVGTTGDSQIYRRWATLQARPCCSPPPPDPISGGGRHRRRSRTNRPSPAQHQPPIPSRHSVLRIRRHPTTRLPPTTPEPRPIITGATAGIGNAFARRLAPDGYNLELVARDSDRLETAAGQLRTAHDVKVEPIVADLATQDGRERVADTVANGQPTDLLVNNAGLSLNTVFVRSTPDREALLLGVERAGCAPADPGCLPAMVARGRGAVVNVASVAGFGAAMPGSDLPRF